MFLREPKSRYLLHLPIVGVLSELSSSLRWKSVGCFFFGRGSTKTSTGCDSSEAKLSDTEEPELTKKTADINNYTKH